MATRIKTEYLVSHCPRSNNGRRAKASTGSGGQATIEAFNEKEARAIFARHFPLRDITAFGIVGVE